MGPHGFRGGVPKPAARGALGQRAWGMGQGMGQCGTSTVGNGSQGSVGHSESGPRGSGSEDGRAVGKRPAVQWGGGTRDLPTPVNPS